MPGGTWAIVPVKPLWEGKSRLGQALPAAARAQLTLAMLESVLRAASGARGLAGWVLVSRDDDLLSRARALGGAALAERGSGLNRALEQARRWCRSRGADAILVLHADLPLLQASEVEGMLERAGEGPAVVLAPSLDGTGTNALFVRPPDRLPFAFGPDSLARHLAAARERGIAPRLFHSAGTAGDVDTAEDLRRVWPYHVPHAPSVCDAPPRHSSRKEGVAADRRAVASTDGQRING